MGQIILLLCCNRCTYLKRLRSAILSELNLANKELAVGVSVVAQWVKNLTSIHGSEDTTEKDIVTEHHLLLLPLPNALVSVQMLDHCPFAGT